MNPHNENTQTAGPGPRDASHPEHLAWLSAMTPGRSASEEAQWRLMEAERLDDLALEALSQESSGY